MRPPSVRDYDEFDRSPSALQFRGKLHSTEGACGKIAKKDATATINRPARSSGDRRTQNAPDEAANNCCTRDALRMIPGYRLGDRQFKAGQNLFGPGTPSKAIYNLLAGWVIVYDILEDGRRQILHFALPGAVLGLHLTQGMTTMFAAQALTDAVVCVIPHQSFDTLSKRHLDMGMRLASLAARDCSLAFDHLTNIGRRSARERVARLVLELFVRCHTRWPSDRTEEYNLPVTQEHIGDATGLTFVHVNRVLRELRREGIMEFCYRRLRILDPDRLIDVAGIDPHIAMSWFISPRPDG
jgi:CRP-like cAMP-binding protein